MLTHKDIDNTDKIETMRMDLYNEEVLYEYETIEHQYLGYFVALLCSLFIFWMSYDSSHDGLDVGEIIIYVGGGLLLNLVFIFFASADIKRIYKFTKNGILTEQADVVPEYAYQCIRMIGRVGVVVCLVAVVFVGPMAFVGAGASALLSFKLVNFRLKAMMFETLYFDESVIIKSSKINYITIVPNAQLLLSLDGIFCNKKNANDIFNTLRDFYPNGHFYEVEEEDDIYSHYKYKEFLHPMDQD
ncbi:MULTISPECIES: hypothetical protein [Aliivibrio]|uniref:Uncharacterized protein n=1 Tax=Aliivibrio finisterrensis TaxID=511998 RepID=A0A4Q5KRI9_9GAMM|nr:MULTISPECIES: hypothetical protein [Aliivibrio]MDD9178774.1 hypothetical protein [Aliivibrio sp. A6]RYU49612.1 hypothetical protein ERW57_14765 [Aliivibrio finisterrensis]RYU50223.1 hypothetical protein ERW56_15275 [Aliivibrio finisterrensis]RYU55948.1 hypothetical protein ERW50_15330 [Aliivibrio finisterrensis]RYU62261.1 hypothetical protein ERW53_16385 [Aliivibrio finisterrensis]